VNINSASREELQQAFQVDGERAEYLVRKRKELGGFDNWEQVKEVVPSFDDKMVENLQQAGLTLSDGSNRDRSGGDGAASRRSDHESSGRRNLRDVNEATAEDFERVFQVDGERARYLVQRRQELGGFSSWEQIKQEVPSFEDKMIQHLEEAGFTMRHSRKE
jgi:DNA uptake protein ComE-like DNA-binding protein